MDTQQFMNLFWNLYALAGVVIILVAIYSWGWRRGWKSCMDIRDVYKHAMHGENYGMRTGRYGSSLCPLDHKKMVDEILEKNQYGYHSCPKCGSWLITLGASIKAMPGGIRNGR